MSEDHVRDATTSLWLRCIDHFVPILLIGLLVGLATAWVHDTPTAKALDRSFVDLMMRLGASGPLDRIGRLDAAEQPPIYFVDIGDQTCVAWSKAEDGACSERYRVQRDKLAELLAQIKDADRFGSDRQPKMIVIDINMSPNDTAEGREHDRSLCETILAIAKNTIVVVPQPIARSGERAYFAPSILRSKMGEPPSCSGESSTTAESTNIWFATPYLPAGDPVIRGVYRWHDLYSTDTGDKPQRIAGLAYLAAILYINKASIETIAAEFPASAGAAVSSNASPSNAGSGPTESEICESKLGERCDEILFRFAVDKENSHNYRNNQDVFEYREAIELADDLRLNSSAERPYTRLLGKVLVIGGSFETSRDLHSTPLAVRQPGAVIHAVAINAYSTDAIVRASNSGLEYWLVVLAAVLGMLLHISVDHVRRRFTGAVGHIVRLALIAVGVIANSTILIVVAFSWGFYALATDIVSIAVLTPALAITFEAACTLLHEVSSLVSAAFRKLRQWMAAPHIAATDHKAPTLSSESDSIQLQHPGGQP